MKSLINKSVFFIGWLLSPLTFWNDIFVNIPISYLVASFLARFTHINFGVLVVACYWVSNIVGLVMMYISGKNIAHQGKGMAREIFGIVAAIVIYSVALLLLTWAGIINPLQTPTI